MRCFVLALVTSVILQAGVRAEPTPSVAASTGDNGSQIGPQQVAEKLAELEKWLATSNSQAAWNQYLLTDQLRSQLTAEKPDTQIVSRVLTRYRGAIPALNLPRFAAVRKVLTRWATGQGFYDGQLPQIVREAQFSPPTEEQRNQRLAQIRGDLAALNQYLSRVRTGATWRAYLRLDQLNAAVAGPAPDLKTLGESARRFTSGHRGLELPHFRRVANDLSRYLNTALGLQDQKLSDEFKATVERLSGILEKQPAGQLVDLKPIVHATEWLWENELATDAVRAIENRFPFKNGFFTVSRNVLQASFEEPLNETQKISEVQQGTRIFGTAQTTGAISAALVPDERNAVWDALFRGETVSRMTGRNRSAVVGFRGRTELEGRKRLVLTPEGLTGDPATASASTQLRNTSVGATVGGIRGCIVTRVASRKAAESTPRAEQTTNSRAESALRQRLEERARTQIADANRSYWDSFRQPLAENGRFPSDLNFMTTKDYLCVAGTFTGPVHIGAPALPPSWTGSPDMGLVLHETAANCLAQGLLAGKTLRSDEVAERYRKNFGKLPARFEEDEDSEPWSITFADQDPIEVQFRDDGVRITIRGKGYTSGDRAYQGMDVTAIYKFQKTPHGMQGVRQGDLRIFPPGYDPEKPGERSLSVREQTLRRMLERRMGKIFTAEIGGEDIVMPGRFERVGPLRTNEMSGANGWLVVAWQQKAKAAHPLQTAMKD